MSVINIEKALAEMGGDEEIFEAVAETFLEDSIETFLALQNAFELKDATSLCRHAHSLKSSSRTVGGEDAGDSAEKLEFHTKSGNLDNVEPLIDELKKQLDLLISELNNKGYSI